MEEMGGGGQIRTSFLVLRKGVEGWLGVLLSMLCGVGCREEGK